MSIEKRYKGIAEKLWDIIDDIDTLSDAIKPDTLGGYARFYMETMKRVKKRHQHLISDGYDLTLPEDTDEKRS